MAAEISPGRVFNKVDRVDATFKFLGLKRIGLYGLIPLALSLLVFVGLASLGVNVIFALIAAFLFCIGSLVGYVWLMHILIPEWEFSETTALWLLLHTLRRPVMSNY